MQAQQKKRICLKHRCFNTMLKLQPDAAQLHPVSLNAISNTGNLSCNNRVATGDGILPAKIRQHKQILL